MAEKIASTGLITSPSVVMAIVGSLVDGLQELLQRAGRHRYGDRHLPASIAFAVTTGCTRRQPPPALGPAGANRTPAVCRVEPGAGLVQVSPPWLATRSAPAASCPRTR